MAFASQEFTRTRRVLHFLEKAFCSKCRSRTANTFCKSMKDFYLGRIQDSFLEEKELVLADIKGQGGLQKTECLS
jgi:hypothetical protein